MQSRWYAKRRLLTEDCSIHAPTYIQTKTRAVLWQGEPRDAAVNFNAYQILQLHHAVVWFLCHSTAFLYTSAIVQ